jgi:hypothetical protein
LNENDVLQKCFLFQQTDDILLKDDIKLEAVSPNGRVIKMSGVGTYNAQFEPDEIGTNLILKKKNPIYM